MYTIYIFLIRGKFKGQYTQFSVYVCLFVHPNCSLSYCIIIIHFTFFSVSNHSCITQYLIDNCSCVFQIINLYAFPFSCYLLRTKFNFVNKQLVVKSSKLQIKTNFPFKFQKEAQMLHCRSVRRTAPCIWSANDAFKSSVNQI